MQDFTFKGQKIRRERMYPEWKRWADLYRNGTSIAEIRKITINRLTGKPYTRSGIYLGIAEYEKMQK